MKKSAAPEALSGDSEEDERLPKGPRLCSVGCLDSRLFCTQTPVGASLARCSSVSLFGRVSVAYLTFLSLIICLGLVAAPCAGQIVTYTKQPVPDPFLLAPEKGAFFVYGKNTKFYFPFNLFGSDPSAALPAPTVTFKNVRLTAEAAAAVRQAQEQGDSDASSPPFSPRSPVAVELALLPYAYVRTLFTSPSAAPFCCSARPAAGEGDSHPSFSIPTSFSPTNECPYPGALKRPISGDAVPLLSSSLGAEGGSTREPTSPRVSSSVREPAGQYVCPLTLSGEASETERVVQMEIEDSDIYFLVASNCGGFKGLAFEGEVAVRNAYGYLPGYEYPKIPFYFLFMLVYLVVCLVWGCLMYRQRANLITFHKFMLVVAVLGFLESLALFVYLYDYNMRGDRNKVLLVVSILVTVVKNIFSYMLVLLGAIGWSITIPVLEKKTVVRMQIIVVLYIILDTVRQVSDEFSNSHSLPLVLLLTCLIPISTLNGVLFYWIISSINNNIEMLQQQKQHEKLLIYRRLYAVLLLAIVLAIIDLLCQIYVASWDASDRWRDQWWLSDAIPHFLFLLVLAAMMAIWRPSQQSRRLAYFTELGDVDDLENHHARAKNAADLHVWGEELDFHDHFSEEELEAGIPNFKLHSVGSLSEDGNLSDDDLHGDEEGYHTSSRLTPTSQQLPTPTRSGEGNKPQPQVVGRETLDDEVEMTTQDGASTNGRRLDHGQEGL
ncbi:putative membrane protein [Toxoplasma gondii GT1]|nr:putative membrane protein [Toxoplasma gondii GT1]PIL96868.1 putative membrane protein [Toxoplasma gondii COUG]RQX72370.1 putative membrane protein [Toxoplasma gondii CAST]